MIDIITEKEAKIKNIKQIGTPQEEDRIYLSDYAYRQMHENHYEDKSVFVLMGHTENSNGRYATFVEAAIFVAGISFERNVPVWNNQIWKNVFTKIKYEYEDLIIVGWGMDIKGFPPRETPELEKVHREQFGGIHQLLFLMNSLEQEEYFYINKNNHLYKKAGFFVYYQVKPKEEHITEVKEEKVKVDIEIPEQLMEGERVTGTARGRYRELLKQQEQFVDMTPYKSSIGYNHEKLMNFEKRLRTTKEHKMSYGFVAAIALLVVVIGGNVMSNGGFPSQLKTAVQTMGESVENKTSGLPSAETAKKVKYMKGADGENIDGEDTDREGADGESVVDDTEVDTEYITSKIPVEEY